MHFKRGNFVDVKIQTRAVTVSPDQCVPFRRQVKHQSLQKGTNKDEAELVPLSFSLDCLGERVRNMDCPVLLSQGSSYYVLVREFNPQYVLL